MSGAIYVFGLCFVTCPEDVSRTAERLALFQTTRNAIVLLRQPRFFGIMTLFRTVKYEVIAEIIF